MNPDDLRLKQLAPHFARVGRKLNGAPEGNLKCERCGKMKAVRNRQRTAYENEESNFAVLCPECQNEADAYWDERWDEYYRGCL